MLRIPKSYWLVAVSLLLLLCLFLHSKTKVNGVEVSGEVRIRGRLLEDGVVTLTPPSGSSGTGYSADVSAGAYSFPDRIPASSYEANVVSFEGLEAAKTNKKQQPPIPTEPVSVNIPEVEAYLLMLDF